MRHALHTMFLFITTLFTASNRVASTLDNYAKWAELESAHFEREASIERTVRIAQLTATADRDIATANELPTMPVSIKAVASKS